MCGRGCVLSGLSRGTRSNALVMRRRVQGNRITGARVAVGTRGLTLTLSSSLGTMFILCSRHDKVAVIAQPVHTTPSDCRPSDRVN